MRDFVTNQQAHFDEAALKKIAVSVRVYLAREHDEHFEGEYIERADEKKARLLAHLERLRGEFKLYLVERQPEIAAVMSTSHVT